MHINRIPPYSFKGLKIEDDAYGILMPQSIKYTNNEHEADIFFAKLKRCKKNEYVDIFVKSDGSVFLTDKKIGKTSQVFYCNQPKIAYCNLYIACSKADMIKECYEKGLNPYELMGADY